MAACAALVKTGRAASLWPPAFLPSVSRPNKVCVCCTPPPRGDSVVYRGAEERSFHGSLSRLNRPPSTHSSLHQLDGHLRHKSQQDVSEVPAALITHGTTAGHSQAAASADTSAWPNAGVVFKERPGPHHDHLSAAAGVQQGPPCSDGGLDGGVLDSDLGHFFTYLIGLTEEKTLGWIHSFSRHVEVSLTDMFEGPSWLCRERWGTSSWPRYHEYGPVIIVTSFSLSQDLHPD